MFLAVICGAATKAHIASEANLEEVQQSLEKGQAPSKDTLKSILQLILSMKDNDSNSQLPDLLLMLTHFYQWVQD